MMQARTGLALVLALGAIAGCDDDTTTMSTSDMATTPADMTGGHDLSPVPPADMTQAATPTKKVIVFVWDGLRPDSVTMTDTPNLFALKQAGVEF